METELNKVGTYIRNLEKKVQKLEQNLHLLLSEDEVKSVPSYALFAKTYGAKKDTTSTAAETDTRAEIRVTNQFDSIYMPRAARGKKYLQPVETVAPIEKKKFEVKVKTKAVPRKVLRTIEYGKDEDDYIDLDDDDLAEALFSEGPKPKKSITIVTNKPQEHEQLKPGNEESDKEAPEIQKIMIKPQGESIEAEFDGVKYIINNNNIYLSDTGEKVGSVNEQIIINNEPVKLDEYKLEAVVDDYYQSDGYAYLKFNDHVAYRIGEYTDDEILAWT